MFNGGPDLWIAATLGLILAILFTLARRCYNALPAITPIEGPDQPLPDCMVVIPARNEEANIGRAVQSLPPDTVIVVDDHSTDRTADVARKAGAGVIAAPDLPRHGLGKPNACAFGVRALTSRWVLFADADTWFEPGFLNAAVTTAEASGLSLLSIYLEPEYQGLAEQTLVPYARALAFAGFSSSTDPRALFRGQCLLVNREPYQFMGGHSAVTTQISEDIKLSMLAERHRLKLAIARAPGLGHVRLYQGYRGIRMGIQRHALRFMVLSPSIGITIMLVALAAALWLPLLAWLVWDRQWIAVCLFALTPALWLRPWYRNWQTALLAPAALYWILPALVSGLISALLGKPVVWKGRRVRIVSG